MRKLWEDHITWTRLAIVSFAGGLPDLPATEARLLANQGDIGKAIEPYYGRTAGHRLTALLREHILGAVALLQAAKSADQTAIGNASAAWYANANQIADFLHAANPHAWSRTTMRAMMKTHLDQTLAEAQHRLQGNFAADVRDYDAVHRHILEMADMLSAGIMRQFPDRFR
jgi:prophage DNA circulation protein